MVVREIGIRFARSRTRAVFPGAVYADNLIRISEAFIIADKQNFVVKGSSSPEVSCGVANGIADLVQARSLASGKIF